MLTPLSASFLDTFTGWVLGLMAVLGGPGAGLAVAIENLFPPIPSEVILPMAGFAASQGQLSLAMAIGWTTAGSVVGALALYGIGAAIGQRRIESLAQRLRFVKQAHIDRTNAWFGAHGSAAVFLGRLIPVVRSLISIPAGVNRMRLGRFVALTAVGSALWNSLLIGAGYLLGAQWAAVEGWVSTYQHFVIGVAGLAAVSWLVIRIAKRRAAKLKGTTVVGADSMAG